MSFEHIFNEMEIKADPFALCELIGKCDMGLGHQSGATFALYFDGTRGNHISRPSTGRGEPGLACARARASVAYFAQLWRSRSANSRFAIRLN